MDNMGSPTPDGTEGIVHVKIPKTDGIGTDDLIGCIINYQKLGIRDSSCYGLYKYMLLLPVNSNNNIKYENIEDINATFYNFEEKRQQTLKLEKVLVEPEKLTHQFLPCIMEDKEKRGDCTFKGLKSESEKAQSYVSKYSKIVGIDILKSREFCKQGNQLFGICKSDNTSRAEFVSLKFSNEPGVLEKCSKKGSKKGSKSDDLHPCGILLHRKEYFVKENLKYDFEVIGSYSLVDGKITYKLILDEVNQTNTSADGSKASNGQNAAMNTDSVPSGSMLSDSSQLEDKQAHNTNKPGAVATNCELNITVVNAENYPLALENGEGEEFLNEDKGEGGVVPNKNTGKNNVKPAAAEQKALDDEKPSSVQEGLVPISKKGKNPVKPAATGGLLTVRTKFPSSQSADESFANPDDISSDRGTLQLAPYASRSAEILNSEAPMPEKISRLNRLKESPPIEYYELVKQETQTQLIFEKLSKGIEYLSNEFMEDEKLIKENLRENQSGQEIKKAIKRNTLRQEIVNDLKKSLALAQTLKNVYEICIQVLEERILDKETIEKLREELDGTKTKLHKLEKEKGSSQQQAKNEAQGPHDSIESLQEKEMAKIQALMLKSISCPEQTTLTELEEKMKQFISLSKKRCDNFRKRSSESSDDDSPDASSNR